MRQGSVYQQPGTDLYTIAYYANGKRVRESTGTANRNAAVRLLNLRLAAIVEGKVITDPAHTRFRDLARILTDEYQANGRKSLKRIKQSLVHLRSFFGDDRKASTITAAAVNAYVAQRKQEKHRQGEGARPFGSLRVASTGDCIRSSSVVAPWTMRSAISNFSGQSSAARKGRKASRRQC